MSLFAKILLNIFCFDSFVGGLVLCNFITLYPSKSEFNYDFMENFCKGMVTLRKSVGMPYDGQRVHHAKIEFLRHMDIFS